MKIHRFLALVLVVTATATCADTDGDEGAQQNAKEAEQPRYIKVVNVTSDDALNVRSSPGGSADVLAQMPPESKALKLNEKGNWIKIVYRGNIGWVYSKYVTTSESVTFDNEKLKGLVCTGTEPHWKLTTEGNRVVYGMYGEKRDHYLDTEVTSAINQRGLWYATAYSSASEEKTPNHLKLIIEADDQCSDGMSDSSYEHSILLINEAGDLLAGCCNSSQ